MHTVEDIEKHLQNLKPDTKEFEQSLAALPPWIPPSDCNETAVLPSSLDELMNKYGDLKQMMETVSDMLNEDSGHLLRVANSALSKAQVK